MTEPAHPWPEYIHQSFAEAIISDPSGTDESVFYAPFTRLLYSLFSIDGPFEVVPRFKTAALQGAQERIDIATVLVVEVQRHPVFFIEVYPPSSIPYDSGRKEAHKQMLRRFRDLRPTLTIPTLHGISAFGTRLAFYEYDSTTRVLQPAQVPQANPDLTDVNCDVLYPEGAKRFRNIVNQVKEMCAQV